MAPAGATWRGAREGAAPGLVGGDPDAALHTGFGPLGESQTQGDPTHGQSAKRQSGMIAALVSSPARGDWMQPPV
jgi:hypothetical protein